MDAGGIIYQIRKVMEHVYDRRMDDRLDRMMRREASTYVEAERIASRVLEKKGEAAR